MWQPSKADQLPLRKRLLWMLLLWLGGVGAVGAVAALIRVWLV